MPTDSYCDSDDPGAVDAIARAAMHRATAGAPLYGQHYADAMAAAYRAIGMAIELNGGLETATGDAAYAERLAVEAVADFIACYVFEDDD